MMPIENSAASSEVINFYSFTLEDLQNYLKKYGKEKFRAQQIYKWVYESRVTDLEGMSNLSKDLRAELKNLIIFEMPPVIKHLVSIDGTQKFLFDVKDGNTVEAVLIPSDDRLTLCISSEIGCNMACQFCFTGKQKLKRRLTADEIVGQFMQVHDVLLKEGKGRRISNIVFMGMGEPLDNSEQVFKSIEVIHSPWGINLSRKKITVSTSGIIPEMYKVAEAKVRLAVSLNGYSDEVRSLVMPINKKYPLKDLLDECRRYYRATGEKITMEYVLLKGVTDQLDHARQLVKLLRDVPCKINLIPFNEHPGADFERPSDETVQAFHTEAMRLGAQVLLRRTMGRDIFAACGQLATKIEHPEKMDISNSKIEEQMQELLVIGSLAYDTVHTPSGNAEKALGGSANYFSIAASFFAQVKVVGVVGTDYKSSDKEILLSKKVDLEGLQVVPGDTFHWEGSYEGNLSEAITHKTELNVFADFNPQVPESYKNSSHVFLANIDPVLQLKVLSQMKKPQFVGMDSMNYWIQSKRDDLINVIKKVDIVFMNETEAKMLSQENNIKKALKKISSWGPSYIIIKQGEYGSLLYSAVDGYFSCPAILVDEVVDPTGAGDSFAGGFFGYITKNAMGRPSWADLKQAVLAGTVMSSQTIQNFSLGALLKVDEGQFTSLKKQLIHSIEI